MDWNAFFSGVAQTSAALIGVILAFIISKILSESTDYDLLKKESETIIIEKRQLMFTISQLDIEGHDKYLIEYKYNIRNKVIDRFYTDKKIDEITTKIINEMPDILSPTKTAEFIMKMERKESQLREEYGSQYSPSKINNLMSPQVMEEIAKIENTFLTLQHEATLVITRIKNHIRYLKNNINDFKVLKNITITFLPIIILTIIYPLHFIPIPEGKTPQLSVSIFNFMTQLFSIKGFFLGSLLLITTWIILFFSQICSTKITQYKEVLGAFPPEYLKIETYCQLFKESEIDNVNIFSHICRWHPIR